MSNDVAEEVISTMRTVRSFACENVEGDRFYRKLTDTLAITRTKAVAYVGFIWVNEVRLKISCYGSQHVCRACLCTQRQNFEEF